MIQQDNNKCHGRDPYLYLRCLRCCYRRCLCCRGNCCYCYKMCKRKCSRLRPFPPCSRPMPIEKPYYCKNEGMKG